MVNFKKRLMKEINANNVVSDVYHVSDQQIIAHPAAMTLLVVFIIKIFIKIFVVSIFVLKVNILIRIFLICVCFVIHNAILAFKIPPNVHIVLILVS